MQLGFKNKNLGKGIRPTLAVISNPEVRRTLAKAIKKGPVASINEVDTGNRLVNNDNDVLTDAEMDTMMEYTCQILLDDNFVALDEVNLFQEASI